MSMYLEGEGKSYLADAFLRHPYQLDSGRIYSKEELKYIGMKAPDCPNKLKAVMYGKTINPTA